MTTRPQLPIPLPLLLLDGVGALLFALGAVGHFGSIALLTQLLPQVPHVDLVAMVFGALLMAAAMAGIIRASLRRARALREGQPPPVAPPQPGLARSADRLRERR
ncbi:hypothetical protein [Sinimarinibacterium thermocellulolyticum]|uniref:Uncharacterized protein n=1 Tax=Sinimarinibacterium thermocellulolyticum TaxID=3170016 RepID=A0ABV2ADF0_9GAMM